MRGFGGSNQQQVIMETTTLTCVCCEETHNEEEVFFTYDKEDNPVCENCEQSYWESSITVMEFNSSGPENKILFCAELGQIAIPEDGHLDHDVPAPIEDAGWVSVGHRGSTHINFTEDYEAVLTGWMTGRYEDVRWKWTFLDFVEDLQDENIYPPFEIFIVTSPTSNVFSIGVDVVIPQGKREEFAKWLEKETEYTIEDLNLAL